MRRTQRLSIDCVSSLGLVTLQRRGTGRIVCGNRSAGRISRIAKTRLGNAVMYERQEGVNPPQAPQALDFQPGMGHELIMRRRHAESKTRFAMTQDPARH